MSPATLNIFEIDAIVSRGLGKKHGESIEDAARRALQEGSLATLPKRRAATILMRRDLDVWDRMRLAAEVFQERGPRK